MTEAARHFYRANRAIILRSRAGLSRIRGEDISTKEGDEILHRREIATFRHIFMPRCDI